MRKTYPLIVQGKHRDRVLDAVKHDIRKYLKRERRRDLPEGMDFWDFDCKAGLSKDSAVATHVAALVAGVDAALALLDEAEMRLGGRVTKLTASRVAPARAVRPMRWV
jgi:hypothetical protein